MITPTDFIPKVVLAMRCTPIVYMYYFFQTKDKINLQKKLFVFTMYFTIYVYVQCHPEAPGIFSCCSKTRLFSPI